MVLGVNALSRMPTIASGGTNSTNFVGSHGYDLVDPDINENASEEFTCASFAKYKRPPGRSTAADFLGSQDNFFKLLRRHSMLTDVGHDLVIPVKQDVRHLIHINVNTRKPVRPVQWGRGPVTAEGCRPLRLSTTSQLASMVPVSRTGNDAVTNIKPGEALEFAAQLRYARTKGISGCCTTGGRCTAEDPEDFAQECLIEYSVRARRNGFRSVQTKLIRQIAHNRLVDAWRKRNRMPRRHELGSVTDARIDAAANDGDTLANPDLQGLSERALDILHLKHVARWLDREIADAFGMTTHGVRSSLGRSRRRLNKKVAAVG